jgi:hypothetical protein
MKDASFVAATLIYSDSREAEDRHAGCLTTEVAGSKMVG